MNITNEQFLDLAEKAKNKDSQAIETIYSEFYNDVYYICYKLLGKHEDAMDLTQDTFLEVFISIDSFRGELSGFRA